MPRFVGGGWGWLDLPQVLAAWRIVNIELLVFQDQCPMALSRPDRMASDSNLRADYTPDLIRSHPLLSASESIPKECRAMVGARQTDEGRKVSVRSAMSPFWLGVGCCRELCVLESRGRNGADSFCVYVSRYGYGYTYHSPRTDGRSPSQQRQLAPALQPSRPETKLTHSTVDGLTNTRPPNNHDDAVNPDHGRNVVSSAPGQHYCVGWSDEASVHSIPDTISKTNPHGDALPAPPRALGMKECADAAG